ncbi:hypothetical protein IWW52_000999 [Coemansia sp. RSA 2704]|nr:hypothetical protein IWW52_000999 [Coemansia sp. RSA 2704]
MPTAEAFLGVLPFNIKSTASPIPRRRNQTQGSSINDRFSRLFRPRGSRVVTTEVNQQRTRADRTCISEFETQYLQQRSTELLLQNDCAVAKLLCRLEISGDRAATMASHLVSFLRGNPQTSNKVEDIVIGAFDLHVSRYAKLSANPRNVLRDNNLATMLVVCYLQQTCRSYLVSILQPVMSAIEPYVSSCELDPMRLDKNDVGTTSRNSYNLYCVCRSVLDAVFSAGKHAPPEMRRLCTLIRRRIEDTWDMPALPPPTPSAKPKVSPNKELPQLPILELNDWEKDLKSTVQVDIMNDIKAALDAWLEKPDAAISSDSASTDLPMPPAKPKESTEDGYCSETRRSIVNLMSSSFTRSEGLDTSLSIKNGELARAAEKPRLSQVKDTWRQTQSPRKHMSPSMSSRFSKHASKRYSGSYFTPVETVISMLIFVRFFIPILTSPEAYGLVEEKISPSNRRGLLLCAKVLAVLCNGVSFGSKEPYLMPMNGLIREYRPKLRQFLQAISSGVDQDSESTAGDEGELSDSDEDEADNDDAVTIDELASQFQVISVGAEIGTKEEQRKSRMSLASSPYVSVGRLTPGLQDSDVPPVPPLPPLPHTIRQWSKPDMVISESAAQSVQPLRKTIDLPTPPTVPNRPRKLTGPIAISSSTSDALLDSEVVDESLVTIDFLSCLEGNFAKFESLLDSTVQSSSTTQQQKQLQEACRELKPIAHYAKHLASPSKMPSTVTIPRPSIAHEPVRQAPMPPALPDKAHRQPALADDEEYEDLGHRRTSTLPGNYKFN